MSETFDPYTGTFRQKGSSARSRAVTSARILTSAIKTSYGALGLDKMCISPAGDVTVTNDGATILKSMVLDDPISDLIVELSKQQDSEMGDGTTGVVLLAAALIEGGVQLIEKGLHPSIVVSGYKMAYKEAAALIRDKLSVENFNLDSIVKTTLASKVIDGEFFTKLIVDAVKNTEQKINGKSVFNSKKINILKKEGGSMKDSVAVRGYCINAQPVSRMMARSFDKPRICLLDFDLSKIRMPLNVNIVCTDPDQIEETRKAELDISLKRVEKILESVDVILTSRNIDDACLKPILDQNKIAIKRVPIDDLNVLSKALSLPIAKTDEIETAQIEKLEVQQLAHENFTIIHTNNTNLCSIILRGPNEQVLEEMHRSVHDGLCSLQKVLETKKVLPGGGALEIALSIFFEKIARSLPKKESAAILCFSECLHVIPKTLASNAGLDPNKVLGELFHCQMELESEGYENAHLFGLDVISGEIGNNIERGILEPAVQKMRALRAAVEVAIAIMRIDEIVKVPKAQTQPKSDPCGDY